MGLLMTHRSAPTRRRGSSVAALCCVIVVALAPVTRADTVDEKKKADQQVAALHAALEGTSTELANAYVKLQQTKAQLPAAQARLDEANAQARAAETHNNDVAAKLAVAKANEARAVEAATANAQKLSSTQRTLDVFAADLFQGGSGSQLSVALGSTSPDDFATRLVMADEVTSLTNDALRNLQNARADGAAQQSYLVAVRDEIAELKRQAEDALAKANAARSAAQTAKAQLDGLVAAQTGYATEVESRKAGEQAQLAAAEAEQARLQAVLVEQARKAREAEAARLAKERADREAAAAAGRAYTPPQGDANPGGGGFLSYPADGPITSEFGMRFHPILLVWKLHTGTDFGIDCGTPVYATAAGTVISAGWGGGYGNRVMIDHGIRRGVDLVTTYNHLSSIVARGGSVGRGQLIGYSGTTGYSTGCHLHFETLEDGSFVNPRTWI